MIIRKILLLGEMGVGKTSIVRFDHRPWRKTGVGFGQHLFRGTQVGLVLLMMFPSRLTTVGCKPVGSGRL